MADDVQGAGASPKHETEQIESAEDAETRATRRELKQSSISDQPDKIGNQSDAAEDGDDKTRPETPGADVSDDKNDELKDQMASPKKKRAHDQLDAGKEAADNDATSVASNDSAKDRSNRLEPEKKRHRDGEAADESEKEAKDSTSHEDQPSKSSTEKKPTESSSSSFASSGFGKAASSSSGFAALGSSKATGFGSAKPMLSSFASAKPSAGVDTSNEATPKAHGATVPKLSFGANQPLSPFAGVSSGSNGFGSGAFGSTLSGIKPLGSFGASGAKPLQSEKISKPFGAPDSDASESEDEDGDDGENESQPEDTERGASPEKEADEKKKPKLHKVEVDDGEAGEVTVVSVRAKMFSLDKQTGWKERGAGMLKINVPRVCVDFDESGVVIPGSFDASGLEEDGESGEKNPQGHKVARLILRQDQTHRVILNTAILPAMEFQEKSSLKSVGILFTALEGQQAQPVSVTMRMSAANAKSFMNEIGAIQRELRGN